MNTLVEDRMYYGWGGMSRNPAHRKLMANYLIHWTAIKWAQKQGYSQYEFIGTSQFKAKLETVRHSWPQPRRWFPGNYPQIREMLFDRAWHNKLFHRYVNRIGHRLFDPMPY